MSLSTLFKSNVTIHAHTSEDFLKLTKKCMERVQKMTSKGIIFAPPKFNYGQCKYLADKLKLVIESAKTLPPTDVTDCFEIIKLVHGFANVVENFIQSCCQDKWIQAAMTMTNLSEHISSLGFYMEAVSQSFLGVLTSTSVDSIYQAEVKIVEEKASYDREALLRNLNALLQTKPTTWKMNQLATLLLERLQYPPCHKDGSTPRFFQNDKDNLQEMEKLGRGAFATVFKASWLGIEVAKKTFYAQDSPDFENEVSILQTLSHPKITSLFGYAKDDQECFMVVELMDEDLFSLIRRRMKENKTRGYPFDIIEAMDMMLQIGGGMKYLHEMQIVHRDLKSMNILVKYVKTRDMKIAYVLAKVSDFGLSRIKQKSLTESNQTPNMGTARWMAPEMIKLHLAESSIEISNIDANDAKVAKHPFKSDVYSFAMVCYEILSGELPFFEEHNVNDVKKKVLRGDRPQLPNHCPPDMKSLIEKCWDADASKRPCFLEIFAELQQLQCSLLMTRKFLHLMTEGVTLSQSTLRLECVERQVPCFVYVTTKDVRTSKWLICSLVPGLKSLKLHLMCEYKGDIHTVDDQNGMALRLESKMFQGLRPYMIWGLRIIKEATMNNMLREVRIITRLMEEGVNVIVGRCSTVPISVKLIAPGSTCSQSDPLATLFTSIQKHFYTCTKLVLPLASSTFTHSMSQDPTQMLGCSSKACASTVPILERSLLKGAVPIIPIVSSNLLGPKGTPIEQVNLMKLKNYFNNSEKKIAEQWLLYSLVGRDLQRDFGLQRVRYIDGSNDLAWVCQRHLDEGSRTKVLELCPIQGGPERPT